MPFQQKTFTYFAGGGDAARRVVNRSGAHQTCSCSARYRGLLVGPLNLVLLLITGDVAIAIVYFLIHQATTGTWSGAGYSCQAENFPTRVRGTAVGWLGSMNIGGRSSAVRCGRC